MSGFAHVPVYIHPEQRLGFRNCTVVRGVVLKKISASDRSIIRQYEAKGVRLSFGPTHVIRVDRKEYWEGLKLRVEATRHQMLSDMERESHYGADPLHLYVDIDGIVRQVLMAIVLLARCEFKYDPLYSTNKRKFIRKNLRGINPLGGLEVSRMAGALIPSWEGVIRARSLAKTSAALDRYYRSGVWWSDRFGTALKYLTNGLCSRFPDDAFVSFTTALECLLSTSRSEITHILAERVAVLRPTGNPPVDIYEQVKKLYNLRSQIVHGKPILKKGRQHSETLYIGAKGSNVPGAVLTELVTLTVGVFNAVLLDRELLGNIQQPGNEDDTDKRIHALFLRRLLDGAKR
jgi:hypothetical protein